MALLCADGRLEIATVVSSRLAWDEVESRFCRKVGLGRTSGRVDERMVPSVFPAGVDAVWSPLRRVEGSEIFGSPSNWDRGRENVGVTLRGKLMLGIASLLLDGWDFVGLLLGLDEGREVTTAGEAESTMVTTGDAREAVLGTTRELRLTSGGDVGEEPASLVSLAFLALVGD